DRRGAPRARHRPHAGSATRSSSGAGHRAQKGAATAPRSVSVLLAGGSYHLPPMPETPQKILVAVAWPYASGPRHLGHVAGPGVPSDIFARYHRLKGNDVLMVSGTDEHGTPVMVSADRECVSPRWLADRNNALILDDYVRLGFTFDTF